MLQRFAKPVLFLLLFAAVAAVALYSDRGGTFIDSAFHMGRFAEWSRSMPLISGLMLAGLSLPALVLLFVPDVEAVVLMVAAMGYWPGFLLASLMLTLAGGLVCGVTKALTHSVIRRWMAARRARGRLYAHRSALAAEHCLLAAAVLCIAGVPAVIVGMCLGLCGMRAKTFCIAALPWLAARAAMAGLSVVPASGIELAVLCLLGSAAVLGYVVWVLDLFQRRVRQDRMEGPVSVRVPARGRKPSAGAEPVQVEQLRREPEPDAKSGDGPALGDVLLVCVRDEDERDAAALIVEEARAIGARVVTCRLNAGATPPESPVSGFVDRPEVADLDEIFVRGFEEGAGRVLAVRAVTPLLRREQLRQACDALAGGCGLVYGSCEEGRYLIGLSRRGRGRGYEAGMLAGRDFSCDAAFLLAGLAPHPHRLPSLPPSGSMRPYLTVFVLAEGPAACLRATLNTCLRRPWTECVVLVDSLTGPLAAEAERFGVRCALLEAAAADGLNRAVATAQGRCLLFTRDGVELPANFEQAVWFTLRQEKCRVGGFSLPLDIPSLQRAVRWLGTAVHAGAFSGPGLEQGVFLSRKDYETFGGLAGPDIARALAALVERAGQSGRVILHNARVRLTPPPAATGAARPSPKTAAGSLLAQVRGLFTGRDRGAAQEEDRAAVLARLRAEAEAMTASCDHCGRCTHVSPTLHRHQIDLSELVRHPLLAWHCFMSGASTQACHKAIDAPALVRLLRRIHVVSHGGRLSRPGHGRTLALARVPVYDRRVREGVNLLLEPDFCCTYPQTAVAMARRLRQADMGVLVADSGARLADLGMDGQARGKVERLRRLCADRGVTQLLTVSPATQNWLVAMNVPCEPVLSQAEALGAQPLDMRGRRLLIACQDRGRMTFLRALAPWLRGDAQEISVPCCGAGGEAAVLEPQLAARLKSAVRDAARGDRVLTNCAGCARSLTAAGIAADLDVSTLMGVNETAVTGPAQLKALVACLARISSLNGDKAAMPAMDDVAPAPAADAASVAADSAASAAAAEAAEEAHEAAVADAPAGTSAEAAAEPPAGAAVAAAGATVAEAADAAPADAVPEPPAAAVVANDAEAPAGAAVVDEPAPGVSAGGADAASVDAEDAGAAPAADAAPVAAASAESDGAPSVAAVDAAPVPEAPAAVSEEAVTGPGTPVAATGTPPAPETPAAGPDPAERTAPVDPLSLDGTFGQPAEAPRKGREKVGLFGRLLSRVTGAGRREEERMPVLDFTETHGETSAASGTAPEEAPVSAAAAEPETAAGTVPGPVAASEAAPAAAPEAVPAPEPAAEEAENQWVVTDLAALGFGPGVAAAAEPETAMAPETATEPETAAAPETASPESRQPAPGRHAKAVSLKDYR